MHIDNRRWFVVAICLPCLGMAAFFGGFLVHLYGEHLVIGFLLWSVAGLCFAPRMIRVMNRVRAHERTFIEESGSPYRQSSIRSTVEHDLDHSPDDVIGAVFWLVSGPILTLYVMIFVVLGYEFLRMRHVVTWRMFDSRPGFFIACFIVCAFSHVMIVSSIRKSVTKEALRVFYHRRSFHTL